MTSKPMAAGEPQVEMRESTAQCVQAVPAGFSPATPDVLADAEGALNARDRAAERQRVAWLARALEVDVIPRLVLARRPPEATPDGGDRAAQAPTPEEVEALTAIVMTGDLVGGSAFIGRLRARDVTLVCIYLDLLAPVARRLGDLWLADRCDFASVTVGLCCLQQLVLENSHAFEARPGRNDALRRILLAAVPGEQHSFGLLLVSEFFRRQGWEVFSATGASARELVATARKQWFSMVGFSLACETRTDALAALIHDIRRASRNPQLGVLVGGLAFVDRPELAALVGADATAQDGQQAVLKAETLLALLVHDG
jgi:methanogenic corrinoid protein MtbC1